MKIKKIVLDYRGKSLHLTIDEAKSLYDELNRMFKSYDDIDIEEVHSDLDELTLPDLPDFID